MRKSPQKNKAVLISFSGIDGAGKSTQIELLQSQLRARGARVHLIAFWDNVAVLTRFRESAGHVIFKGEKGIGRPDRPVNRRDKNVRSWYMTWVRFVLYFLDAVSLALVARRGRDSDADVIIFDRYLYDQLANLPLESPLARSYARFLLAIVPQPDVAYLLDADPQKARQRKPEYPIEFLRSNRASYLRISQLGQMTVVAPGEVSQVADRIVTSFLLKLQNSPQRLVPDEKSA